NGEVFHAKIAEPTVGRTEVLDRVDRRELLRPAVLVEAPDDCGNELGATANDLDAGLDRRLEARDVQGRRLEHAEVAVRRQTGASGRNCFERAAIVRGDRGE